MQWVKARNAKSLGTLQSDPRYQKLHADALRIVEATDRIATPDIRGRTIYNFWQDPTHVRGILRRTTPASYRSATPEWETVLDVDTLSTREGANWVWHGASCLRPEERRCLVALSNGGKDADEMREFDVVTKQFVDGGFRLPESKGSATWVDENTLLVWRDFGPGTLTKSGYPFIVKRLERGKPLDQAVEVFRGAPDHVSANAFVLRDADGRLQAVLASRNLTFYEERDLAAARRRPRGAAPLPEAQRHPRSRRRPARVHHRDRVERVRDRRPARVRPRRPEARSGQREADTRPPSRCARIDRGRDRDAQHARGEPEREREGRGVRLPARRERLDAHAARAARERHDRPRLRVAR